MQVRGQFERVAVQGTCNSANTEVLFDVQQATGSSFFANAFFPDANRAARTLFVDDTAFTTRDLDGILRHEMGHILGFRHEHIWTAGCTSEGSTNARQVTAFDQGSVMHYPQCRTPAGGGYRQTLLDYDGAVQLYGLSPALVSVVTPI